MTPAVLFARRDSIYKSLPCDVWDEDRDARNFAGTAPVVAHPPCRAWGRLRGHAKPAEHERALALLAVDLVRRNGGVLEHPASSSLWLMQAMPPPGHWDACGGITFPISQSWFGHRAEKLTWLYVVGLSPLEFPDLPPIAGSAPMSVCPRSGMRRGMPGWRPSIRKPEREATPPQLAQWLLDLAGRCRVTQ